MKHEMEAGGSEEESDAEPAETVSESGGSELQDRMSALEKANQELQERISALEKANQEYLDKLKRLQADFENYKKRVAKEREEYSALAAERIIRPLLDLLDDFERALANSECSDGKIMRNALEMMYKQLRDILRKEGVVEIATDCMLDPFEHEAMSKVDKEGKKEGEIVECLQKGYKIRDKVIRPARVVVCHREAQKEEPATIKEAQKLNLNDGGYIDTDE